MLFFLVCLSHSIHTPDWTRLPEGEQHTGDSNLLGNPERQSVAEHGCRVENGSQWKSDADL